MNKLTELDEALTTLVAPGMAIHLTTHCRAATRAIQRVFSGRQMDLTLIMGRIGGGYAADLVASGLIKHVIAGSYGAVSRGYTGPLPQIQEVHAQGRVTFQHWSFLSLTQRLAAAAQGFPFLPTHSLAGSSMARDNVPDYARIADPSGRKGEIGVVTAVHPDISVIHALAADEDGNTVLVPPLEDTVWGAKACSQGTIVTTERIVSRKFIRAHSHLVRIPARYVRAVCHMPFGAHPGGFGSPVLPLLDSYSEDEEFSRDYFAATRNAQLLEAWIAEWIDGCGSHREYLGKLGERRCNDLKHRARLRPDTPKVPGVATQMVLSARDPIDMDCGQAASKALTRNEMLMTLALREVMQRVRSASYDLLLVGVGLSEVPATAARNLLAKAGIDVTLVMGHGFYGFEAHPGQSEPDPRSALMTTDSSEIYGVVLGGRIGRSLAILGTAQVDRHGNLNSTIVDGRLLTASGGSNDASSVCDTVVVTRMSRRKLVHEVEYVTSHGTRVRAVITDCGVFERSPVTGQMILTQYVATAGKTRSESLAEIAETCGWKLELSPDIREAPLPRDEELAVIRWLMPGRYE